MKDYRRRRVNAGGNVFAFYRSRWLRCPSLPFARWAGLDCLLREVGMFGVWESSLCLPFPGDWWGCSARFPDGMGRSVDLDLPGRVPEAGLCHAHHAACSTWRPGIVIGIEMRKKTKNCRTIGLATSKTYSESIVERFITWREAPS